MYIAFEISVMDVSLDNTCRPSPKILFRTYMRDCTLDFYSV